VTESRVVVAVSDPMLRALLVAQVEQVGHIVIGEADAQEALLRMVQAQQPDVVVLQWLSLGMQGGERIIPHLLELYPKMRLVTLVDPQQPGDRIAALASGVWACASAPPTAMEMMSVLEQDRQVAAVPRRPVVEEPAAAPVGTSAARSAQLSFLKRAV